MAGVAAMPVVAWLSLGSNVGDSCGILARAVKSIRQLPATELCAVSALYETPPWGDPDQAPFHNAVLSVRTGLDPEALLDAIQKIESNLGRVRDPARRWGPRTIDIDILIYGEVIMESPALTIPHARLGERAFVLLPLLQTQPDLEIPGLGAAAVLLKSLSCDGIAQIAATGWENESAG